MGSNPIGSTIFLNYLRLCDWLRQRICVVVCAITPLQTPARECIQGFTLCFHPYVRVECQHSRRDVSPISRMMLSLACDSASSVMADVDCATPCAIRSSVWWGQPGDALRGGKRYQSDCGSAPNSRFARFRNSRIAAQASVFGGMTRSPASVLVVWRRSIIVRSSFRTSSRKRAWVVTASSVWAIPVKRMLQRFRPTSQRAAGVWGRALSEGSFGACL